MIWCPYSVSFVGFTVLQWLYVVEFVVPQTMRRVAGMPIYYLVMDYLIHTYTGVSSMATVTAASAVLLLLL